MRLVSSRLARASKELGDDETAIHYARVGARLYQRLHLIDSALDLLLIRADVEQRVAGDDPTTLDRSIDTMRTAWEIVQDRDDHPKRPEVLERYAALLRAASRPDDAEALVEAARRMEP